MRRLFAEKVARIARENTKELRNLKKATVKEHCIDECANDNESTSNETFNKINHGNAEISDCLTKDTEELELKDLVPAIKAREKKGHDFFAACFDDRGWHLDKK